MSAPGLGVAPMYSATLDTTLTITLTSDEGQLFDVDGVLLTPRAAAAFPKGVWGPAQNPKAKTVPAGDTIDACDGLTIDTVLPDSLFTGAPPIDYHQIELPLTGRKPLPFVTNTAKTDARVTAALALKDAAKVLTAGALTTDVRFERAAIVLDAAGGGRTTVAALRGERSAPPSFGSLADDLADSPAPDSPPVTPVVVDRTKPPPPRFAPIVKSVLGVPLALTLDRPGGTTVGDPGSAVPGTAPSLAAIRAETVGRSQLALSVVPLAAQPVGATLGAVGAAPATRIASGAVGAVANARPVPAAADRLAAMSDQLLAAADGGSGDRGRRGLGRDRPRGRARGADDLQPALGPAARRAQRRRRRDAGPLARRGGPRARRPCPRVAGRRPRDDAAAARRRARRGGRPRRRGRGGRPGTGVVRVAVAADGRLGRRARGRRGGHRAGQPRHRQPRARRRRLGLRLRAGQGGAGRDRLHRPGDGRRDRDRRLPGQRRRRPGVDAAARRGARHWTPPATRAPPEVLVDGVRTILLYAIAPDVANRVPRPGVLVDGCGKGHLGGVIGSTSGVDDLAALLATRGVEAAVAQPLVGGPGQRQVSVELGDGPIADLKPRTVPRRRRRRTKPATKRTPARKGRR